MTLSCVCALVCIICTCMGGGGGLAVYIPHSLPQLLSKMAVDWTADEIQHLYSCVEISACSRAAGIHHDIVIA